MKKLLALLLALVLLGTAAMAYIAHTVSEQKEEVTITQRTIQGDAAAAEGAILTARASWYDAWEKGQLAWDITQTLGDMPAAAFLLNPPKVQDGSEEWREFSLNIHVGTAYNYDTENYDLPLVEEPQGLWKVCQEQLERANESGEKVETEIDLRDACDTFPVVPQIYLEGAQLENTTAQELQLEPRTEPNRRQVVETFGKFFTIPVTEEVPLTVVVWPQSQKQKDQNRYSADVYREDTREDGRQLMVSGWDIVQRWAFGGGVCVFAIENKTPTGHLLDTSQIPGGYGLYAFLYQPAAENLNGAACIDAGSLQNICPLSQTTRVLELNLDQERRELYMVTEDEGERNVTFFDLSTLTVLQTIPVRAGEKLPRICPVRDGLVIIDDGKVRYMTTGENGQPREIWAVSLPENLWIEINSDDEIDLPLSVDVKDDRLILCTEKMIRDCQYLVAVLDSSGVLYYGEYFTSLSSCIPYGNHKVADRCMYCEFDKLEIAWPQ